MAKFVQIKNSRINVICSEKFEDSFELSPEFCSLEDKEILLNVRYNQGKFSHKGYHKDLSKLKIALVGNWKMQCGISTYAENLWPEISKYFSDIKLFIEHNPNPTGSIYEFGDKTLLQSQVISCWKRGENLSELVKEIKNYNPDIILINHEFGLFPSANHWLSFLSNLNEYRVITTMHSTFHHKDKSICEAAVPEIIVHLEGAKDLLKNEKKISSKVYVIPHGCYPCISKEKFWNLYKTKHTVFQMGFGFTYKNFEDTIAATSLLKNKYPDVFFSALFSESAQNKNAHQGYYNKLMDLVQELGLEDNTAIIRGFQSDEVVDAYLRTNQIVVLPYRSNPQHEVYGASGAARLAMSKAIPVVSSSLAHFSDLPTLKADSPEQIAEIASKLFDDKDFYEGQVQKQLDFVQEYSWKNVAKMYTDVFVGTK